MSEQPQKKSDVSRETSEHTSPQKNKRSSVYIYLVILFGAAFLMLLLAYFVQQRNSDAVLDDLRLTTASREELLEDIKELEEKNEDLQKQLTSQVDQISEMSEESNLLEECLMDANKALNQKNMQKMSLEYIWYLERFMKNKEYPMASALTLFSADHYRRAWNSGQISINPAQLEQYEAYRQELIDKGYLQQLDQPRDGGTDIWFTDQWDPSMNEDTAALSILWLALQYHFINEYDNAASQYLFLYPLGNPNSGYQERVERLASKFTLEQFQLLKDELVEDKWLVIEDDGTMSEGYGPTGSKTDELYPLPFGLPESALAYVYVYGD